MSQSDRITASNDRIRQLADEYLPGLLALPANKLAGELLNPETGVLGARIDRYRRIGRRRHERRGIEDALCTIPRAEIAQKIGVDVSSLSRWLNGITSSDKVEQIFVVYREELRCVQRPTEDECAIAGYCYAIERYRDDVADALQERPASKPPLTAENFCYLAATLRDASWHQAMRESDPVRKDELLVAAASRVFEKVADPARFPSYQSASRKPPETILAIHRRWGLWFRLIMYAGVDASLH